MIKVYVKSDRLEDEDGITVEIAVQTLAAAKRGNVTDSLRRAVCSALGEEVILV
jgi:hypothetical protein